MNFLRRGSGTKKEGPTVIEPSSARASLQLFEDPLTGISFTLSRDNGNRIAVAAAPRNADQSAGIQEGDLLETVDGQPLPRDFTLAQLKDLFQGKKQQVKMTFSRTKVVQVVKPKPADMLVPVAAEERAPVVVEKKEIAPAAPAPAAVPPPPPPPQFEVKVGDMYDVLHKCKMDSNMRDLATATSPEPNTGWRWRACTVLSLGEENDMLVRFMNKREGYPDEATVPRSLSSRTIAPLGFKSPDHVMHHNYKTDDVLDVLDFFRSKYDNRLMQKWRKCQIVNVRQYYIRVTFCGWSDKFDISLHVLEEADRLAEFGKYTEREQVEETQRESDFRAQLLKKRNLRVVDVSPDGNCLFRAISVLLYGHPDSHEEIRNRVCDYLLQESARFELFLIAEDESGTEYTFADYVRNMRKLAEWGGEPELRILEEIYDRPIEVYSCDVVGGEKERDFTVPLAHYNDPEEEKVCKGKEPLRLSFHGNNHYNAVCLVEDKRPGGGAPFVKNPEQNEGKIRALRKGSVIPPDGPNVSKRLSFRAPSQSRNEPK